MRVFKRFVVMLLTAAVLALGFLSALLFLTSPLTYWWLWIPNGLLSIYIFQPVVGKWEKTFNRWFGLDDRFNPEDKL